MTDTWTTAFVDDHPIMLEGIVSLFSTDKRFNIVGKGANAHDALDIAVKHRPDIIFVDLSMPGDVFASISTISEKTPDTRVIVLTAFSSVDSALRALDAGATGFVLKSSTFEELLEAVEAVMRGEMFITKQYASQVMGGLRHRSRREEVGNAIKLSVREKQIIGHVMQARTNREIASSLKLSERTVKHYMTGLMSKLRARNRVELVIEAQKANRID